MFKPLFQLFQTLSERFCPVSVEEDVCATNILVGLVLKVSFCH